MSDDNLGPKPDAKIEPGETNPGGADAIDAGETSPPVHDLDPDSNPAVEEALPEEMKKGEDTSTKATESDGRDDEDNTGDEGEADEESPA